MSTGTGTVRIGISGWTYAGWRGDFYPRGLVHRRELEYAASQFASIEINGSFYSLQRVSSYRRWAEQTPEDFVFALKGGRYITHMKRLADARTALANFFASGPLALGCKLGPLLWQLPPTLTFDEQLLMTFFEQLPRSTGQGAQLAKSHDAKVSEPFTAPVTDRPLRHALEVRHPSLVTADALDLLRSNDIAVVVADTAGRWPLVRDVTSDFVYVRLHGDEELYASGYDDAALDRWADRMRGWLDQGLDVYAYFDNDIKGYAPHDAVRLAVRLGRAAR